MRTKKVLSLVIAMVFVLGMITSAYAATGDLTVVESSEVVPFAEWTFDDNLFGLVTFQPAEYEIEVNEKNYNVADIMAKMETEGATLQEAAALLDAEEATLEVAEVSAIDKTTIEVTFSGEGAPAEAVEVALAEALVHGQTEVTFIYEEVEYTATLAEAWVDSLVEATEAVEVAEESLLEVDLASAQELVTALEASDAKTLLQARINSVQLTINGIVTAVNNATTEVQLYNALNVKPFVNVDVAFITAYDTAITGPYTTISEIQTIVDTVNTAQANTDVTALVNAAEASVLAAEADPDGLVGATTETLVEAAQADIDALPTEIPEAVATALSVNVTVKADLQERLEAVKVVVPVIKATNQIQLLAALQNDAFARVNDALIATYETDLAATDITIPLIQTKIDAANLTAAQSAVVTAETPALTAAKVSTAQVLVNYLPEDVAPATTKAALQTRLDVVTALIAVADATTEAGLLTALENEDLALTSVNPAAIEDYKTLVDSGADITTAANVQTNVIDAGNVAALTAAVADVETNFVGYDATLAADQTAALAELNRLAEVSADVDADTILPELIEDYIVAIEANLTSGSTTITGTDAQKAAAIQVLILAENAGLEEAQRLAAVNAATTAAEMRTALTAVAVAETDAYVDLTSQEKLEVAELVLVARDAITAPVADEFALTTDVITAISNATSARSTFLTNVNAATTISGMATALDVAVFPEFQALSDLEQVDAAEAVLVVLEALKAETPAAEFETIAEIKTAAGL